MIFYSFKVFGANGLQPLSITFNVFQYYFQCPSLLHFGALKCKCWRKLSANNFVISIHLQKEVRIECKEVSLVGLFFLQGCVSSWIVWRQERFFSAANTFSLLRQTSPIHNPILRTRLTFKIASGGLQLPRRRF